jgi:hypothetical protein
MKFRVFVLATIILTELHLRSSHATRVFRSDGFDPSSLSSGDDTSSPIVVDDYDKSKTKTDDDASPLQMPLRSSLSLFRTSNESDYLPPPPKAKNSIGRLNRDHLYADLEFKFLDKAGSEHLGYILNKMFQLSNSSGAQQESTTIVDNSSTGTTKHQQQQLLKSLDNVLKSSSAKTTLNILFRQREKLAENEDENDENDEENNNDDNDNDDDDKESSESLMKNSPLNSSYQENLGDRGKSLLASATSTSNASTAAITILLDDDSNDDDEVVSHKRLNEKRLNKLIFQNLVRLFNDYKLYFFLLSILFTLLIVFIVVMIFYSYMLSKSYSKAYKRSSKYLLRCRRTNNSFDIIDSGYKINRSSFKPIDRERSNSALAISSLRGEIAAIKRASVATAFTTGTGTGELTALYAAAAHRPCASIDGAAAAGSSSVVGVYVPVPVSTHLIATSLGNVATTTTTTTTTNNNNHHHHNQKKISSYGSVKTPTLIKHHGLEAIRGNANDDNDEELFEYLEENEYGFGGTDTLLKPKSVKSKNNDMSDAKPDDKRKSKGILNNNNNNNNKCGGGDNKNNNEDYDDDDDDDDDDDHDDYTNETNFYELPYIDSTLLSTSHYHNHRNRDKKNNSNGGHGGCGNSNNVKFETFTAKRYETYKKSFNSNKTTKEKSELAVASASAAASVAVVAAVSAATGAVRNSYDEYTDVKYTSFNSNSTTTTSSTAVAANNNANVNNNNANVYNVASSMSSGEQQLLHEYFARESNDNDYDNTHYEKKRVCSFLYDPPPSAAVAAATVAASKYPSYVQKSSFEYLTNAREINAGNVAAAAAAVKSELKTLTTVNVD